MILLSSYCRDFLLELFFQVVLAYGSYLYFDHPYEADPEERGLYWATRKISTYDVWGFHQNMIDKDRDLPCPDSVPVRSDCYELKKPENVVGKSQLFHKNLETIKFMKLFQTCMPTENCCSCKESSLKMQSI